MDFYELTNKYRVMIVTEDGYLRFGYNNITKSFIIKGNSYKIINIEIIGILLEAELEGYGKVDLEVFAPQRIDKLKINLK